MEVDLNLLVAISCIVASIGSVVVNFSKIDAKYLPRQDFREFINNLPVTIKSYSLTKDDVEASFDGKMFSVAKQVVKENNEIIQKDIKIALAPFLTELHEIKMIVKEMNEVRSKEKE